MSKSGPKQSPMSSHLKTTQTASKQSTIFRFKGDSRSTGEKPLFSPRGVLSTKQPTTAKKPAILKQQKQLNETKRIFLPAKYETPEELADVVLLEPRVEVLDPNGIMAPCRNWYDDFDMLMSKYNATRTPTFLANDRSSVEYRTSMFNEYHQIRLSHNTVECGRVMADWFQKEIIGLVILIHPCGTFCTFKLTLNDRHLHIDSNEEFLRNFDIFLGNSDSIEDGLNRNVVDGPEAILHLFHTNFFKPSTLKSMPFHVSYDCKPFDCSLVFAQHQIMPDDNDRT